MKNAIETNLINEEEIEALFPDDKMERLNNLMRLNNKGGKKQ